MTSFTLVIAFFVLTTTYTVIANDNGCCGNIKFDPADEECCGGTTIVAKGRCCNGTELQAGFECCNKLSPPRPYNPETTCCTESALYSKGAVLPIDISKCPDRVVNSNYEPKEDGCGLPGFEYIVPQTDFTTTVSFKECCNGHDLCYQICNASRSERFYIYSLSQQCMCPAITPCFSSTLPSVMHDTCRDILTSRGLVW